MRRSGGGSMVRSGFARNLRRLRPRPTGTWHLDEISVSIQGSRTYLWRAVDSEGETLDILIQSRRDKASALKLMRKLLKRQGIAPSLLVTDKLRSDEAARRELGLSASHEQGLRKNDRAGKLPSAGPTTREKAARLQITRIGRALPVDPLTGLQHLQPPAPADLPPDLAPAQGRDGAATVSCDHHCLKKAGHQP